MSISSSALPNFSPPAFEAGLAHWSSGDGTAGSDSYAAVSEAAYVPSDSDFSGCLELIKTHSVQKLRAFAKTPMRPETYLRISTRIKSVTGNLPAVRIAAWAGNDSDDWISAATQIGPSVALSTAGEVVEISAIVGPGLRDGVDMVWGSEPTYGHFGLDLTGASGGIVRIDDFEIQDVTGLFHREMINVVDVRDYGALGDDKTDNYNGFVAADQAANGRQLLVPEGIFHITRGLLLSAPVQIQGRLVMPDDAPLVLSKSYNLSTYIDALKSEELAFKKAFQALLNSGDHDS
ncbi:MAG: right-handed parallel beta-helix repeat-containing protein, partial [Paracoccaceae bacterium]